MTSRDSIMTLQLADFPHKSHDLRNSDASSYDYKCVTCGNIDKLQRGDPPSWGRLAFPCPGPSGVTSND